METPEKMILRDGGEYLLINLYGIDFKQLEGSVEGYKPLAGIAGNLEISLEHLQSILKWKGFLNENNEIAETKCKCESFLVDPTFIDDLKYPCFALYAVIDVKDESAHKDYSDRKDSDYKPVCIWGHEHFIKELVIQYNKRPRRGLVECGSYRFRSSKYLNSQEKLNA